jgi:hypothetical protein
MSRSEIVENADKTCCNEDAKQKAESATEKRMSAERSIISVPYTTPKAVFEQINTFLLDVLKQRKFEPLSNVENDLRKLERLLAVPLALNALESVGFHLSDMEVNIALARDLDNTEDLSLPQTEILGELKNEEINLTLRLCSKIPPSILSNLNALELKTIKLKVLEDDQEGGV